MSRVILRIAVLAWLFWIQLHAAENHVILITIDGFPAYLMEDPQAPIPTLRKMAQEGVLAEGMKVSNPSVTWPNHTTLVTGVHPERHSVLFNGVLVRPGPGLPARIDPKHDKADLVAVPTVYDFFYKAGLRTAGINWPCTRNSGTLHYDFPDVPDQVTHMTADLRKELIAARILRDDTDKSFTSQSAASKDQMWTAAAVHVIEKHKPNFLLFHMLITDSTHHRYGAQSPAGYTAVALADSQLRSLLDSLKKAGIAEQTTIFVVADHGFEKALRLLNPNVLFRQEGLLETAPTPTSIVRAKAHIISEGGTAMVYLTDPATREADAERVRKLLEGKEGIAEILGPDVYSKLGLPHPKKNPQMADLVLVARDGYAFVNNALGDHYVTEVTLAAGNQGHHGYLSTNPRMNAVFVAWGRGIKRGGRAGILENVDVAPTIAHLLGHDLPKADGKVLKEVLAAE